MKNIIILAFLLIAPSQAFSMGKTTSKKEKGLSNLVDAIVAINAERVINRLPFITIMKNEYETGDHIICDIIPIHDRSKQPKTINDLKKEIRYHVEQHGKELKKNELRAPNGVIIKNYTGDTGFQIGLNDDGFLLINNKFVTPKDDDEFAASVSNFHGKEIILTKAAPSKPVITAAFYTFYTCQTYFINTETNTLYDTYVAAANQE